MRVRRGPVSFLLALTLPVIALAADLKPETTAEYDRHIAALNRRYGENGPLWIDGASSETLARLRAGQVVVRPGAGDGIVHVTGGLIHDWRATAFAAGASLDQVLAVTRDYDNYASTYDWVIRSGLTGHDRRPGGDRYRVYLRLKESTKFVTGVLDLWTIVDYRYPQPGRAIGISHADCIRQVEDAGQPDERRLPVGTGSGFLWRADTFSTYVERDNGVYMDFETVGLSRTIPPLLSWFVEPIARRLGRGSATQSLERLRQAVVGPRTTRRQHTGSPIPAFWCSEQSGP